MAKVEPRTLPAAELEKLRSEIDATFSRLGLKTEGRTLLFDLLTASEMVMVGKRLRIAKRLLTGESLPKIAREIPASFTTIRSVDSWLGARFDSYRSVLPEVAAKARRAKRNGSDRIEPHPAVFDPTSFRALRRRYKLHFLLLNVLLGDPWKG
jgi:uncharacterized protein YerC